MNMVICDSYDKYAEYGVASKGTILYIQIWTFWS